MAVQSYSIEIHSINIYKFGSLKAGLPPNPDGYNSLNIMPQVHEVTTYESIFAPVIRCEIAVFDYIGLFTNFPMTGEEVVIVEYRNVGDDTILKWTMAIDSITDITADSKNRAVGFIISCTSIEGLANVLGTVQQGYRGTPTQISKQIFEEHIVQRVKQFYPGYRSPNIFAEDNSTTSSVIVVPNMHPIAAIDMVNDLADSEVPDKYTYLFFQNSRGFNFRTLQNLTQGSNARRFATKNKYKFFSDEITDKDSKMNNDVRVVTNLSFNKRHSSMQKIAAGYFNNNLYEINIGQKAIFSTRTKLDDITTITKNKLNTTEYQQWAEAFSEGDEQSNRTRYAITTRPEHDVDFPVYRSRTRWGKDLSSKIALSQVDLTAVIPGTNRFVAGDMFYLEIPEFHGFNDMKNDDLVSGFYLITEIKQIIAIGGFQTTVLKLNKDSYGSSVDRPSRYKQ